MLRECSCYYVTGSDSSGAAAECLVEPGGCTLVQQYIGTGTVQVSIMSDRKSAKLNFCLKIAKRKIVLPTSVEGGLSLAGKHNGASRKFEMVLSVWRV